MYTRGVTRTQQHISTHGLTTAAAATVGSYTVTLTHATSGYFTEWREKDGTPFGDAMLMGLRGGETAEQHALRVATTLANR